MTAQREFFEGALRSLIKQLPEGVQTRMDSWSNALSGLGTIADKATHTSPTVFCGLSDEALAAMFHGDELCRRAVTKRPRTALAKGVTLHVPDEAGGSRAATRVQDAFDDLCVAERFADAATWENLFGGSAIYVGVDDGQYGADSQAQPIRLGSLQRVLWLKVVDRRWLRASDRLDDVIADAASPDFGEPSHYMIDAPVGNRVLSARVHRDRLIIFPGATCTAEERARRGGWGISTLDPMYEVLQRNASSWQSAGNAVTSAQYTVMKLKGLAQMLGAAGGEEKLKARSRAIEIAKSMINAVLIDADDTYDRGKIDFGNLPEMLDRFQVDVAGALDMPVTILFGRSPAGMNATGKSDQDMWHASVEEYRTQRLRPRLEQLVRLLMLAKRGPTGGKELPGWRVSFPPLAQLSDLEVADRYLKTSQADAAYIEAEVLLPHEVALSRFRAEGFSSETTIDLESRRLMQDAELSALEATTAQAKQDALDLPLLRSTTATGSIVGLFGDRRADGRERREG